MRPRAITLEGFASYRTRAEVDLTDVDFFSLTGATGAGKSSLVDAMVFALYGRIPKLGARAVAPVISAGADRARVSLEFDVEGVGYAVARLVQRTKAGGATVKEARLQSGDEVLADGASEVTSAVEELLRLRFEDFTRTVVLPQGEFARFLTADKSERQALLRSLLGLDVYTAMRGLSRTRESVAVDRAETARARLDGLAGPDQDGFAEATTRLDRLEALAASIVERERMLAGANEKWRAATDQVGRLERQRDLLHSLTPPARLDELDSLIVGAHDRVGLLESAVGDAAAAVDAIAEELASLPSADALAAAASSRQSFDETRQRLENVDEAGVTARLESATDSFDQAVAMSETHVKALEAERIAHSAHALTLTLRIGEPCPVCHQEVEALPRGDRPAALAELEEVAAAARAAVDAASREVAAAREARAALASQKAEIESRLAELVHLLDGAPSLEEIADISARRADLSARLAAAKDTLGKRRSEHLDGVRELEEVAEAARSVGLDLMAARELVAELAPPLPTSDDTLVQWKEFLVWRDEKAVGLVTEIAAAREVADAAGEVADAMEKAIVVDLDALDVPTEPPLAVAVTRQLEILRASVADIEKQIEERKELEGSVQTASDEAALASALAGHLRADGFERWLMAGAIADLVAGANDRLGQLSRGGYSLDSDSDGSFSIVDHGNADEVRPVATLSGGETFLVSLALALSLAETLAARGGAALDAVIIDEGFGTLDEESLDTVASVLEDLAGGLMVGVITHVKELAGRAPTLFEVVRGPGGSKVHVVS